MIAGVLMGVFLIGTAVYGLVLGIAQVVASRRLARLQSQGGVNAVAVMSLLPLYPLVILGAPIAIWTLIFANGARARRAFDLVASGADLAAPRGKLPPMSRMHAPARSTNSATSILSICLTLVWFACLLGFFSAGGLGGWNIDDRAMLSYEIGAFAPWFILETWPEEDVPLRWQFNWLAVSWLFAMGGIFSWWLASRLSPRRGDRYKQISRLIGYGVWPAVAAGMVLLGFSLGPWNSESHKSRFPLIDAIRRGNFEDVQAELSQGAVLNVRDSRGLTPLMWAVKEEHDRIAKELLRSGADVNGRDSRGNRTPLIIAAELRQPLMTQLLIEHGADVNQGIQDDVAALSIAAAAGNLETMKVLIEGGARISTQDALGRSPLDFACQSGDQAVADLLIEKGAGHTAVYLFWQAYRKAVAEQHSEAAQLAEQASGAAHSSAPWRFAVDGWSYQFDQPQKAILLVWANSLRELRETDEAAKKIEQVKSNWVAMQPLNIAGRQASEQDRRSMLVYQRTGVDRPSMNQVPSTEFVTLTVDLLDWTQQDLLNRPLRVHVIDVTQLDSGASWHSERDENGLIR